METCTVAAAEGGRKARWQVLFGLSERSRIMYQTRSLETQLSHPRFARRRRWIALGWAIIAFLPNLVQANINLELRPVVQGAEPGSEVQIGLYAVSDSSANQLMAAADVIIGWDPAYLHLLGKTDVGAVPLLVSGFPYPDPYNLNEVVPPQDGDGFYIAYAYGGQPVAATPAGALLTTFRFQALAETPATQVLILPSAGSPLGHTVVYDGTTPGLGVTGTLGSATVAIRYCGDGDVNGDGHVDLDDVSYFVAVLLGTDTDPAHVANADVDCSGAADGADIQPFVDLLLGAW